MQRCLSSVQFETRNTKFPPEMEHSSNNQARTLFGDSVESNVVVAAALMLLTVLATEFVINFEVRKIRDRRKRRNYIVDQRRTLRRRSNYKEKTENIFHPKQALSISEMIDDPHLTRSQSETRPFYIHPRRFVKKSDKIKLTLDEKELSKRLLSIYFNRLNKLIEDN